MGKVINRKKGNTAKPGSPPKNPASSGTTDTAVREVLDDLDRARKKLAECMWENRDLRNRLAGYRSWSTRNHQKTKSNQENEIYVK